MRIRFTIAVLEHDVYEKKGSNEEVQIEKQRVKERERMSSLFALNVARTSRFSLVKNDQIKSLCSHSLKREIDRQTIQK